MLRQQSDRLLALAAATVAAAIIAVPLRAQLAAGIKMQRTVFLDLSAGYAEYDLSGVDNAPTVSFHAGRELTGGLLLEGGLTYFGYNPQFGERITYAIPEVGLQANLRLGPVLPFLGISVGYAAVLKGNSDSDLAVGFGIGSRIIAANGWGARIEGRVRSIDPWVGTIADVQVGIVKQLR